MKLAIDKVGLNSNEKRYHQKRNNFLGSLQQTEESPKFRKFVGFFEGQREKVLRRPDRDLSAKNKGSVEKSRQGSAELKKQPMSTKQEQRANFDTQKLQEANSGLRILERDLIKQTSMLEAPGSPLSTAASTKIYSFDNIDDFPSDILTISRMKEDLGPFGLPQQLKDRLKDAVAIGLFEHSILKKNYFYFDETMDVEYYKDLSSYGRKVLRNSK